MRRIIHTELVSLAVNVERESFNDVAVVTTLGPSNSPREADGRGQIMVEFGRYTPEDAPWWGAEPEFRLTIEKATELRNALDNCVRMSDG